MLFPSSCEHTLANTHTRTNKQTYIVSDYKISVHRATHKATAGAAAKATQATLAGPGQTETEEHSGQWSEVKWKKSRRSASATCARISVAAEKKLFA